MNNLSKIKYSVLFVDFRIYCFCWVNDEKSKRAYDSKTYAYRVFQGILDSGNPPDNWNDLLTAAKAESERLEKASNIEI